MAKKDTGGSLNQSSAGYILNGSSFTSTGSASTPPRRKPEPAEGTRPRRRLGVLLLILVLVLLGAGILILMNLLTSSSRDIEIAPTSGIIQMDGEDVAIVIYQDGSRPGLFEPSFQNRASAIRLSDGEQLWDQRLDDELMGDLVLLSGDEDWIYIGSDAGLMILAADSGEISAEGTDIPGFTAAAPVLAASAYGFDPESNSVVALDESGQIMQIKVGDSVAGPADPAVASRWKSTLSASPFFDDQKLVQRVDEALGPDGTEVAVVSVSEAVERDALTLTSADGRTVVRTELTGAAILPIAGLEPRLGVMLETGQFLEGTFEDLEEVDIDALLEQMLGELNGEARPPVPAGWGQGYVLVQHRESVNAEEMLVSSIDIASGRIVDTAPTQIAPLRAFTGPGGTTAVAVAEENWSPNLLLVLDDDGTFREVEIGAVPWWLRIFV